MLSQIFRYSYENFRQITVSYLQSSQFLKEKLSYTFDRYYLYITYFSLECSKILVFTKLGACLAYNFQKKLPILGWNKIWIRRLEEENWTSQNWRETIFHLLSGASCDDVVRAHPGVFVDSLIQGALNDFHQSFLLVQLRIDCS